MSRAETCPRCGRAVEVKNNRFRRHNELPGYKSGLCMLSEQRTPITGDTPADHEQRARLLLELAVQVQDQDPRIVWDYLTATPAVELQRLLMFALAALPADQTVEQAWRWVTQLPTAKVTA